jgi:hypothetical protein
MPQGGAAVDAPTKRRHDAAGWMKLQKQFQLILALARVLFVNGQSTERFVAAVKQLAKTLGLFVEVMPRWCELQVEVCESTAVRRDITSSQRLVALHDRMASRPRTSDLWERAVLGRRVGRGKTARVVSLL